MVLHMWISQDSHHQFSPIIMLLSSRQAPSGARILRRRSVKAGRILTPTWQTDITAVSSGTLITGLTATTEAIAMISSMKTGTMMAGAMTMITGETVVEMENGVHLGTNRC